MRRDGGTLSRRFAPACGLLLAVLAFEVLVRQLAFGPMVHDSEYGWIYRSTTVVHRLSEGWGVSHWDAGGTRAAPPPAPGDRPLLFVGDSFTEALQVGDDDVFTARVQRALGGVRAFNVGRASHSAADYVELAPSYLARAHPVWTVIQLNPEDLGEDATNRDKTHFEVTAEGGVRPVRVPARFGRISRLLMAVRARSAFADSFIGRWEHYRAASRMPPLFRASERPRAVADVRPSLPVVPALDALLRAYGGRVTILFLPQFDERPGDVEKRVLGECVSRGLSCVDLRSTFPEFANAGRAPYGFPNSSFGEGHLNLAGHAAAARLLVDELRKLKARGLF